ncbi:STAS domain-containing protein [Streptosporangium lutulentum]|uniref:Anti-sigma factor antagonist n=1 Tax=Streptosporangium lutulentum TaxID=1461250 RepID=A0ABT9Q4V0_9ACTN|nr:STAS domain-containing protein [Streptosporangium lutulentum]MDP9841708.1 anti-anti-sigma factor [Streptosporangium lutulentum]
MTPLSLTSQYLPGGTVVWVTGEVDATNSARLLTSLDQAHPRPQEPLLLDLSALTFLDCSGLATLLHTRARLAAAEGRLSLAAPHERVRRLLELTGHAGSFEVRHTLDEAVTAAGLRATAWIGSAIA